jgi:formylglycine-generating enzyme required for sulfatase activity
MLGNVWEWAGDWYSPNYYRRSAVTDPQGAASLRTRAERGSSWDAAPEVVRASVRFGQEQSAKLSDIGFRCAGDSLE